VAKKYLKAVAAIFFSLLFSFGPLGAEEYALRDAAECTERDGLPNVFKKLEAGQNVKIAYLGGSITAQPGWRPFTLSWFKEQYPQAKVEEINAAIGGTGSGLGVFRLQYDVIQHHPDLLFVEFAVNDGGQPPHSIHCSMEGIVRQTWKANPEADICYVYTLTEGMLQDLQSGKFPRAASAMEELADHYGIPSIHMGVEVARLEKEGRVLFKAKKPETEEEKAAPEDKIIFSSDGVHPHPETGHKLYLEAVIRSMEKIKSVGRAGPHERKDPFVEDNWEDACMLPLQEAHLEGDWEKLSPEADGLAKRFGTRLPDLWVARTPGSGLSFRFKGCLAGVYDLLGPDCGQVIVRIDDREPQVRARIDGYCTYHRLAMMTLASDLSDQLHTVDVKIHSEEPDKRNILHEHRRHDMDEHPEKYEGTSWYAGAIMLIGDLE